jgi:polyhydroxyalkanoate synthesis regulator phasin
MLNFLWGSYFRKLTSIFSFLVAFSGSIIGVPLAWSAIGLPEVASKMFVHDKILEITNPMLQTEAKLLIAQQQQQSTLNQILLQQLQSSLYSAEKDMAASPSQTVQERIDALKKQIQDLQTTSSGGH